MENLREISARSRSVGSNKAIQHPGCSSSILTSERVLGSVRKYSIMGGLLPRSIVAEIDRRLAKRFRNAPNRRRDGRRRGLPPASREGARSRLGGKVLRGDARYNLARGNTSKARRAPHPSTREKGETRMSTAESTTQPRTLARAVEPSLDGETVLAVLRRTMLVSDATVRRAKEEDDGITLDGVRCKTNEIVRSGQILSIVIDDEAGRDESAVEAEPGPLSIAYEDDDLLVIDKPAGLVVHPGPGHENGTLCNFVSLSSAKLRRDRAARPVQRLDRTTSGLVVFAKNAHAQDRLQRQMHTRDFERTYLAVCTGSPDPESGVVDAPIVRITRGPSVFAVRADGKRAVTRYETLARWSCAGPRGQTALGPEAPRGSGAAAGAGVAAGAGLEAPRGSGSPPELEPRRLADRSRNRSRSGPGRRRK